MCFHQPLCSGDCGITARRPQTHRVLTKDSPTPREQVCARFGTNYSSGTLAANCRSVRSLMEGPHCCSWWALQFTFQLPPKPHRYFCDLEYSLEEGPSAWGPNFELMIRPSNGVVGIRIYLYLGRLHDPKCLGWSALRLSCSYAMLDERQRPACILKYEEAVL